MPAHTAVKAAMAVLAGAVAVSALAGCSADVGALQHRTSSYSLSGQVRTLVVNAHVGGVHVTGGDSVQVSVTEHISFRGTAHTNAGNINLGSVSGPVEATGHAGSASPAARRRRMPSRPVPAPVRSP